MFRAIRSGIRGMDKVLFFVILVLTVFGAINIITASSREAVLNMDQSIYFFFYRHMIAIVMGLVASVVILCVDTKHYKVLIFPLFLVALALNIFVIVNGAMSRGAAGWIDLGFFNLQPSEVSKPILIALLAVFIEAAGKVFRNPKFKHGKLIALFCTLGVAIPLLVFFQRDLGTSIVLLGIFGMMFLFSPIIAEKKWKAIGGMLIVTIIAFLGFYAYRGSVLSDAQTSRLDFRDPCSKYSGSGYQICNAYIAINLGGLEGVGIGKSTQKYSYIPEPHTDMVFAILAEEYGYIVCIVILILYIILLWRILMLSSRANTIRGKYICLGVATFIFLHLLLNLGGLFALIPLTGLPLPFLSYGGSHMIALLTSLAIVQRVHMETASYKPKF